MNAAQIVVSVALVAVSSPAAAAAPVRLAYEAPRECPTEPEFVAAVTSRGASFDGTEATEGPHLMVVSIHRRADGFAGAFHVRDERDTTNKREVRGATCAEVADALAVVTAIALHTDADGGGGGDGGGASPPAAASAPALPAPTPPAPPKAPAPDDRLRGSTRVFPPRTETVAVQAGTLRFDLQRSATIYTGASFGTIPSVVVPRADISLLTAHFVTAPGAKSRIAGLVFRLRVGALGPATYQSLDTKTNITAATFGIDLCQSPVYDTKGLVLLVCSGYGAGVMTLNTKGLDGSQVQSKNGGFGDVTASAEAQYYLGAGFHIGAKVGGGFTVGQVTAERADGSRIFATSTWSGYAMLGLGFRF